MKLLKTLLIAAVCGLAASTAAKAETPEKPDVSIAVGGKVALYYLPLNIAESKGYFKDEGLRVRILDFQGGAKSVQAVVGGSADVLSSSFEHMINLQAKGQELTAFALQGRYPGFALSVAASIADKYKGPASLKRMKIGVTAPGSSTHMMVNLLLSKAGLKPDDVAIISVGAGAGVLAAVQNGLVDAVVQADPATTLLTTAGSAVVKVDTRNAEGTAEVYGGPMPAATLSAPRAFIEANPRTVQALTNAMVKSLAFLQSATAEEIYQAIPEDMRLGGDHDLYLKMIDAVRPSYSPDGLISEEAAKTALSVLQKENPAVRDATINLPKTYTNEFVNKSPKGM